MTVDDNPGASSAATGGHPRVLVVCTGNLCRSPLAAALLSRRLVDAGVGAHVSSAGTGAPQGRQPDRKLLKVAAEHGLDLAEHRSHRLRRTDLDAADLVLVMTREQQRQVVRLDPDAGARTVALRPAAWKARMMSGRRLALPDWVDGLAADVPEAERPRSSRADDIPDPVGRSLRHYRAMADEVDSLTQTLAARWGGR